MNLNALTDAVYLLSALAFLLGLKLLTATAKRGLFLAAIGLLSATVVTLMDARIERFEYVLAGLALGGFVGIQMAKRSLSSNFLSTTTLFNGFGGLACLLTAWAEFQAHAAGQGLLGGVTLCLTAIFGSIAFSGSAAIWARLEKKIGRSEASKLAGQKYLAKALALAVLIFGALFSMDTVAPEAGRWLALSSVAALILSALWASSLDDVDLKAALALLSSCTGLAVCAAGFVFQNVLLVAVGGLASGGSLALANAICKAENRPISGLKNLFAG
jgi:NAD(P) transhydrogenase subunit beta